jgi:Tol biopolymer transport system component
MTPGQAEPIFEYPCGFDYTGCLGGALGPGSEELTLLSGDGRLVVVGYDGAVARDLGPAGRGPLEGLAWGSDGTTLAIAYSEYTRDQGSLTVVLRSAESGEDLTLYEVSEDAPAWYDVEDHRIGSGPGMFNSWDAPQLEDLQWAPDGTQLAFVTTTTPPGGNEDERQVQWRLHVADVGTGTVEYIADLGRCSEPVDESGQHADVCGERPPSLSWTPDGKSLTVLADGNLMSYDPTGTVLSSERSRLIGPIVWMTAQ